MIYLAIDPGKNGAVAVTGHCEKCPATIQEMRSVIARFQPDRIVIEQVGAMPHDSPSAAFAFGQNYGQWQALIAAAGIPLVEIRPQKWQKMLGFRLPKDKAERKRAIKLWVEKRIGREVTLYAADAAALQFLAERIWREEREGK